MRLQVGASAPSFEAQDYREQAFKLAFGRFTLLSVYRYASCPFCNLPANRLVRATAEWGWDLGLLALFQSPGPQIAAYAGSQEYAFTLLADPEKKLYAIYGLEASWVRFLAGFVYRSALFIKAMGRGFLPGKMEGTIHRLPADFLIDPERKIIGLHYGRDLADHMPLNQLGDYLSPTYP